MYRFDEKRNQKTPNDVKLSALEKWSTRFLYLSVLTTKIQNFDFSKINTFKFQNFEVIKTEIYDVNLHTNNAHAKFQTNMFILGCAMKKTGKADDVTFLERLFWHF